MKSRNSDNLPVRSCSLRIHPKLTGSQPILTHIGSNWRLARLEIAAEKNKKNVPFSQKESFFTKQRPLGPKTEIKVDEFNGLSTVRH